MLGFAAATSIVDTLLGSPFPDPDIVIDHNTQCPTVRSTPVPAQMWAVGPGADVGSRSRRSAIGLCLRQVLDADGALPVTTGRSIHENITDDCIHDLVRAAECHSRSM